MAYTPGPWRYIEHNDGTFGVEIDGGHQLLYDREGSCPQCFGNMRLISKAPDLFEILKELTELMDAVVDGSYTPDSFTTQPARILIKEIKDSKDFKVHQVIKEMKVTKAHQVIKEIKVIREIKDFKDFKVIRELQVIKVAKELLVLMVHKDSKEMMVLMVQKRRLGNLSIF